MKDFATRTYLEIRRLSFAAFFVVFMSGAIVSWLSQGHHSDTWVIGVSICGAALAVALVVLDERLAGQGETRGDHG